MTLIALDNEKPSILLLPPPPELSLSDKADDEAASGKLVDNDILAALNERSCISSYIANLRKISQGNN